MLAVLWLVTAATGYGEALRVPAFTAYLDPDPNGARISPRGGVTRWSDSELKVLWFGELKQAGRLRVAVALSLPLGVVSKLRLSVAGEAHEAQAKGAGPGNEVKADFGTIEIKAPGYQRFELKSLNVAGTPFGDLAALVLDGPAAAGAHFNLKERRNAASVHLMYPVEKDAKIDWFYNEVTAVEDPVATYYMACGFHRGYFGMQVNGPAERRIIFSVWDAGSEAVSRAKVGAPDRVQLVAKGDGVDAGDFGNEGTGGHSHLVYNWKTGETQRFLVGARAVDATHTIYAGYWWHPEKKAWMLIAAMKAPKDGGLLRGLYSFSENFGGSNGHLLRKALYGNQWVHAAGAGAGGEWKEQTTAKFSHDPTGREDRLDRFMGVEDGKFFLSQGGFKEGFTKYGEMFNRPATGKLPEGLGAGVPVIPEMPGNAEK